MHFINVGIIVNVLYSVGCVVGQKKPVSQK